MLTRSVRVLWAGVVLTVMATMPLSGCSSDSDCPAGSRGCPCYANSTCDSNLMCASGTCKQGTTTVVGTGGSDSKGTGGTTSTEECPISDPTDACEVCTMTMCCDDITTCAASDDCYNATMCIAECTTDTCTSACVESYPTGSVLLLDILTCMDDYCAVDCG